MKIDQIEVGKTYEGRTGKPRTVVYLEPGYRRVWFEGDDIDNTSYENFAAWAKSEAPTSSIADPMLEPYASLSRNAVDELARDAIAKGTELLGTIAVLREALEKINLLPIQGEGDDWEQFDRTVREIARTALVATDVLTEKGEEA